MTLRRRHAPHASCAPPQGGGSVGVAPTPAYRTARARAARIWRAPEVVKPAVYLGKAGIASGFGAAGSIVVQLVWVFCSSQILPLGAEFTWLYAHNHGSRAGETMVPCGAALQTRQV
jgi:hypothetical protein